MTTKIWKTIPRTPCESQFSVKKKVETEIKLTFEKVSLGHEHPLPNQLFHFNPTKLREHRTCRRQKSTLPEPWAAFDRNQSHFSENFHPAIDVLKGVCGNPKCYLENLLYHIQSSWKSIDLQEPSWFNFKKISNRWNFLVFTSQLNGRNWKLFSQS